MFLEQGFVVELGEPWAVTVALEAVRPLGALRLILDGIAVRCLARPATVLTARQHEKMAMSGGRRYSHVQCGEGE